MWGSESSNALYLGEADLFTKTTGIEYEAEYLSWDDYWTKINTLAAANDLPDTLRMDYAYILNYVNKNQLMDLTPLVESGAIDLSKVPDSAISGGRFGEGLYGINAGSNGLCMAVNEKLVTDAGMEVPSNEMTWEEFEKWAIEFHEKTGKIRRGSVRPEGLQRRVPHLCPGARRRTVQRGSGRCGLQGGNPGGVLCFHQADSGRRRLPEHCGRGDRHRQGKLSHEQGRSGYHLHGDGQLYHLCRRTEGQLRRCTAAAAARCCRRQGHVREAFPSS